MDANLEQLQGEETQDINSAWVDGRMVRFANENGTLSVIVISKGKVVADFMAWQDQDGDHRMDVTALYSRVGERAAERDFVKAGWSKGKSVAYNTITGEIELR